MLAIVLLVVLGVLHASDQVNITAPAVSGCCDMEPSTDVCAWILTYPWQSAIITPPFSTGYPGFAHAPNYFYLQDSAGGILDSSASIVINDQYTIISLDYYFYTINPSPDSYLNIYFVPDSFAGRVLISDTNIPIDNWIHKDIPCNDKNNYCCGLLTRFPCTGTIEVVGSLGVSPPTGLMAVDNIGTCATTPPPCCKFTSNAVCDFTNAVSNTNDWYWFGTVFPLKPPPLSPSGGYVFFEASDSPFGQVVDNTFRSQSVTIASTVAFVGGFYVDSPYGNAGDSGLKVNFVNSNTGTRHEMAYYKTTSGSWQTLSFSCPSGNCCDGFSTCAGWLEFVAHVDYPGGYAFYGVSFFGETGYPCPY